MDDWKQWFAMTGAELDVQDALLALERVLGRAGLGPELRDSLERAAAALRQLEKAAGGDGVPATNPSEDLSPPL